MAPESLTLSVRCRRMTSPREYSLPDASPAAAALASSLSKATAPSNIGCVNGGKIDAKSHIEHYSVL